MHINCIIYNFLDVFCSFDFFFSLISFVSRINPVTGVVQEDQPNPMEGMTEEQKEYEAMKLVDMFDKLSRSIKAGHTHTHTQTYCSVSTDRVQSAGIFNSF